MIKIFGMAPIDFIIYCYISIFVSLIGYKIVKWFMFREFVRVEVLTNNHEYYEKKFKSTDDSKFKFNNNTNPNYAPLDFFIEKKPSWVFWRLPKIKLVYVSGMTKVVKFSDIKEGSELRWMWSNEELAKYIKKLIAKSKAEIKPISRFEFIVLAILLVVIIVFQIILMNRMRVF